MKTAIEIIGKNRCAGCFGCYNACEFEAISMGYDEEGFYYPFVDHSACTECGLCIEHCPVIEPDSGTTANTPAPPVYAARSRDLERVRKKLLRRDLP